MNHMSRTTKILLGIASLWPIVYMGLFMAFMFGTFFFTFISEMKHPGAEPEGFPVAFAVIFALHFFTILWIFGLLGVYIWHLFVTDRVPKDQKALWAVVLFLGNMMAMPVYWYLYIWREPRAIQTSE